MDHHEDCQAMIAGLELDNARLRTRLTGEEAQASLATARALKAERERDRARAWAAAWKNRAKFWRGIAYAVAMEMEQIHETQG